MWFRNRRGRLSIVGMNPTNASIFTQSAESEWPGCLTGRLVYHATPLHYLPAIVANGALHAKSLLAPKGTQPRRTAFRRDLMLGLADCVHFSFDAVTPLLIDKLRRGYPHVVLGFDAVTVGGSAGATILPVNTKSWRSRSILTPIVCDREMATAVMLHIRTGKMPGIELLARYAVGIDSLKTITYASDEEFDIASAILSRAGCNTSCLFLPPVIVREYKPCNLSAIRAYFDRIIHGSSEVPPALPFD